MKDPNHPDQVALATMAEWVGAIADNVGNPVAGIRAALSLIEREMESLDQTGTFHRELVADSLGRASDRLNALGEYITGLSQVLRPPTPHPERILVADAFAAALKGTRTLGAKLQSLVSPGAEMVFADPAHLHGVLKSLIANATEAAAAHVRVGPRVQLQAVALDTGVALSIEDNGPGFNAASLERGTQPFFSTKEAGTGLGLAIAERFAFVHGGTLEIGVSKALGGAAVTIFLPHGGGKSK